MLVYDVKIILLWFWTKIIFKVVPQRTKNKFIDCNDCSLLLIRSLLFSFCKEDCTTQIQVEYSVCVGQCTIALGHSADAK